MSQLRDFANHRNVFYSCSFHSVSLWKEIFMGYGASCEFVIPRVNEGPNCIELCLFLLRVNRGLRERGIDHLILNIWRLINSCSDTFSADYNGTLIGRNPGLSVECSLLKEKYKSGIYHQVYARVHITKINTIVPTIWYVGATESLTQIFKIGVYFPSTLAITSHTHSQHSRKTHLETNQQTIQTQ